MAIDQFRERSKTVENALREHFPNAINILTEPGYQGLVHVRIVSREFNGLSETEKQDLLWESLKAALAEEAQWISLGLAYGTNEYYNENEI